MCTISKLNNHNLYVHNYYVQQFFYSYRNHIILPQILVKSRVITFTRTHIDKKLRFLYACYKQLFTNEVAFWLGLNVHNFHCNQGVPNSCGNTLVGLYLNFMHIYRVTHKKLAPFTTTKSRNSVKNLYF